MKKLIKDLKNTVLAGCDPNFDQVLPLVSVNDTDTLEVLFQAANEIRERFVGKRVELCAIINGKSGRCTEDCKYCAQANRYHTNIKTYNLLPYEEILKRALEVQNAGVKNFSLVTSGKGIMNREELEHLLEIYQNLSRDTALKLCASHGIITYEQALCLKKAGITRYHHNVETSRNYFSQTCTTHTYEERFNTIKNVKKAGLEVCCGGIIGVGETAEERIRMAFEIKEIGAKSVPINILNPINGTPYATMNALSPDEIFKTMALFRFILPDAYIRYAGGRILLGAQQIKGFGVGVNAAIVGDYLTTVGNKIKDDQNMIRSLGLEVQ